jgi:hypothetical protein
MLQANAVGIGAFRLFSLVSHGGHRAWNRHK